MAPFIERRRGTVEERFWNHVNKTESCWLWTGTINRAGYGRFRPHHPGNSVSTHRYAYELVKGSIPDGMDLHHLCYVRHCVNPAHLAPETPLRNRVYLKQVAVKPRPLIKFTVCPHCGFSTNDATSLNVH